MWEIGSWEQAGCDQALARRRKLGDDKAADKDTDTGEAASVGNYQFCWRNNDFKAEFIY